MNAIVLVDDYWGIGCDGAQNIFIKADLQRFKTLTQDSTVILGRKTLATFPGGKPLPKRRNLILSQNTEYSVEGAEVCHSVQEVMDHLKEGETAFVIGGDTVYQQFLPHCATVYVTKVEKNLPADSYFLNLDQLPQWECTEESQPMEEDGVTFRYCTYQNSKLPPAP